MASVPYLDDGSLNDTDEELSKNSTLIQDLSSKFKKEIIEIEKMSNDYIVNIKNCSGENMEQTTMASIRLKFNNAQKLWDDKVQITKQNYALLEKRIKNLNTTILKLEEQTIFNDDISETTFTTKRSLDQKKGGSKKKMSLPTARAVGNKSNTTKRVENVAAGTSCSSGENMNIDPEEPTFCLCKQVSYGEMIACDNPDCAIEWFHFECVSLITAPKGKWFCANCIKDKKKK